mmetsp:Transcript_9967/g.17961  ORF Transcript_9967/g.17961 Transcript_9967/m.17961 type:complete len:305 (+) Transcript_9967:397-1311(+)|eukprot:CAMPEP_0201601474 /NCGR_PEP_ID=MMETSP0492-20130828/2429_1 /ASSEMBLY_ACC=CAM_ASM_000837 /TAXON_ID=420259 /ORGANISM="Thalassiosira gravida, Strain GMp14c1" /LENGTH=304 /DNA_ID=CAMNT_0048064705 /DNA_START=379 /DNA_END=1293 /DNA_ORIENTATION=-
MDESPEGILQNIVGFLPPSDAIQLNKTCKKLHSRLSLTATCPRQILMKLLRKERDVSTHYGFQIPVPHQVTCHSILLSMFCRGGQGKRPKGKLFIVAEKRNRFYGTSGQRFGGGRVVYTSGMMYEERRLYITFQPKKNETYHLWYVGAGYAGGANFRYVLSLSDLTVQALVFDDPLRCFGKASNFLTRTDTLHAWDHDQDSRDNAHIDTSIDIERFLITLGEHLLPPLVSFADDCIVSEANLQLQLRRFVKSLRLSWTGEFRAYEKIKAEAELQPEFDFGGDMQVDDFLEDRMDFGEYLVPEND